MSDMSDMSVLLLSDIRPVWYVRYVRYPFRISDISDYLVRTDYPITNDPIPKSTTA